MFSRYLVPFFLVLAGTAALLFAVGRAGPHAADAADPGTENAIKATAQAAADAYSRGDFGALLPLFSDKGFEGLFQQTKAEALADSEFFGDPVAVHAIRNVTGTSDAPTATVEFEIGLGIEADKFTFATVNGRLRIEASEPVSAAVPTGAKVVDLKLQEFAFVYDKAAVAGGNVAFNVTNVGKQDHEIIIFKVEESVTAAGLRELLLSEDESSGPPPIEDFGFLGLLSSGVNRTAALAHPLEAGKYVFVCFVPDTDGAPHVAKGMISEFTVGAGTGAITPPSTGDGGLIPFQDGLARNLTFGVGLILVTFGSALSFRPLGGRTLDRQANGNSIV